METLLLTAATAIPRTSLPLLLLLASAAVPLDSQANGPKQYGKSEKDDGRIQSHQNSFYRLIVRIVVDLTFYRLMDFVVINL